MLHILTFGLCVIIMGQHPWSSFIGLKGYIISPFFPRIHGLCTDQVVAEAGWPGVVFYPITSYLLNKEIQMYVRPNSSENELGLPATDN